MAAKVARTERRSTKGKPSSREILLNSACTLMIERGTTDVTLSDIAQHSGLNSALVKYYFGTKQGMMLALVDDVLSRSIALLEELLEMPLSSTDKLKFHIRAIIGVYFRYPFINRLIHQLFEDPEAGQEVAAIVSKPLAEAQRKLLNAGMESGEFRHIDPMMFYFIVIGACDHLFFGERIMRVAFGVEGGVDDDMRQLYTDTLLDMVLKGILK